MVTAVMEVHRGVDNLWKSGASAGMKAYPNYGQYIPVNYMKAFLHGLPYLWANEMYWDVDANMLPFDFIQPFVDQFNSKRTEASKSIRFCCRRCWNILLTILFAAADIECHPHHSRRVHVCVATKDFKDRWLTTHKSRATQAYTARHNAKECGGMSHWYLRLSRHCRLVNEAVGEEVPHSTNAVPPPEGREYQLPHRRSAPTG